MGLNVIEEFYLVVVSYIHYYGWYMVFILIALYYSRPYLKKLKEDRSLRSANDPQRRSALDAHKNLIRQQQQLNVLHSDEKIE